MTQALGPVEHTQRGFGYVSWLDVFGFKCELQASSSLEPRVWLGPAKPDVTPQGTFCRMHLDEQQVRALIKHLQAWLDTGSFTLSDSPGYETNT